jgi:hypothetical protein
MTQSASDGLSMISALSSSRQLEKLWRGAGVATSSGFVMQRPFLWDNLILAVNTTNSRPVLSPQEKERLGELESIIAEGFDTFLKVGLAFAEVRFYKLQRAAHDRFEDYCRDRWGLSASRTNQIINTVKVVENIVHLFPEDAALLEASNECALRPLSRLEPELQTVTWELIRHIEQRPSGTTIQEVVSTIRGAIESGWQDRERQVTQSEATREASHAPSTVNSRNGTTKHRTVHRQSDQLGNLSHWANLVNTWNPAAIEMADDELCLKCRLKAARQLKTF